MAKIKQSSIVVLSKVRDESDKNSVFNVSLTILKFLLFNLILCPQCLLFLNNYQSDQGFSRTIHLSSYLLLDNYHSD